MKSMILALAALGLFAGASNAAVSVQCDRNAVFQTCNYAANNQAPTKEKAKPGEGGGEQGGGDNGGSGGSGDTGGKGGHDNNGYGNGDQNAPGKSGDHNNAENSDHSNHHGNH